MLWHQICWILGKNALIYLLKMKDRLAQLKEVGSHQLSVMHLLLSFQCSVHALLISKTMCYYSEISYFYYLLYYFLFLEEMLQNQQKQIFLVC